MKLIIEQSGDELWGRVDDPSFLATTCAENMDEVIANIRAQLQYLDPDRENEEMTISYDIQWVFKKFPINISEFSRLSGINESLMRQYAAGKKHPSEKQARRIEAELRELGSKLQSIVLFQ